MLVTALSHARTDLPAAIASKFDTTNADYWALTIVSRQSGHTAAECTEPRSAEGVECKHCSESMFPWNIYTLLVPNR